MALSLSFVNNPSIFHEFHLIHRWGKFMTLTTRTTDPIYAPLLSFFKLFSPFPHPRHPTHLISTTLNQIHPKNHKIFSGIIQNLKFKIFRNIAETAQTTKNGYPPTEKGKDSSSSFKITTALHFPTQNHHFLRIHKPTIKTQDSKK